MAYLCDIPIHDLAAGDLELLGDSRNKSGASASSEAHLKCNLRIKCGGRHLLLGKNGCGKTTLLHAIHSGNLSGWPRNVSTFLVDQELKLLHLEKNVLSAVLATDTVRSSLQQKRDALEKLLEKQEAELVMENISVELNDVYEKLAEHDDDTVRQRRAKEILMGLGFSSDMFDLLVRNLSGGWRMRVALAAALFMEPHLLLLDEPTNHLDVKAIIWLQKFLVTNYTGDKTLMCVSHDRSFINSVLTEIMVIQDRALTYFNGTLDEFEAAAEEMAKHMEHEAAVLEKKRALAQKAVEQLEVKDMRQFRKKREGAEHNKLAPFHPIKQKDTGRVSQLEKKLQRVGMEKTLDGKKFKLSEHGDRLGSFAANEGESKGRTLAAAPLFHRSDPSLQFSFAEGGHLGLHADMPILQVKGVSYAYPDGKHLTLTNVDLCIPANGRIALAGSNGAGKSTLVNLMLGRLQPTAGEVWRHHNAKIAFLGQHEADQLQCLSCSSLQYMQECFPDKKDLELRALLGSFGVKGSLVHQSLSTLSGGQRVRVVFAKICEAKPHLLVLDEPTNHLDIYSIDALMEGLQNFKGAVVLVTHNCSMLNACATELYIVGNKVCHAASCPVGMKLGGWLMQCHSMGSADSALNNSLTIKEVPRSAEALQLASKDSGCQSKNSSGQKTSEAPNASQPGLAPAKALKGIPPWLQSRRKVQPKTTNASSETAAEGNSPTERAPSSEAKVCEFQLVVQPSRLGAGHKASLPDKPRAATALVQDNGHGAQAAVSCTKHSHSLPIEKDASEDALESWEALLEDEVSSEQNPMHTSPPTDVACAQICNVALHQDCGEADVIYVQAEVCSSMQLEHAKTSGNHSRFRKDLVNLNKAVGNWMKQVAKGELTLNQVRWRTMDSKAALYLKVILNDSFDADAFVNDTLTKFEKKEGAVQE